jgi:ribosomal protein S18 acetylase RimI-like enzyme
MACEIRPAHASDTEIIAAFNAAMARETEGKTLCPETVRRGVAALLTDSAKGRYYLAEHDGEVVGQLMLTYEWSDWRDGCFWWIQSVYVHPAARGRKVFSQLFRHVERLAREDPGVCGLRLYVDRDNTQAQAIYAGLGLLHTSYDLMESVFERRVTAC